MTDYIQMLNNPETITTVSIQAIYDVVYAKIITSKTLGDFKEEMYKMDEAIISDGIRTMVEFTDIGNVKQKLPLAILDPQLREVMVFARRLMHGSRDEHMENDYRHLGIEECRYQLRLSGQNNLKVPGTNVRAGDLKELAVAMREQIMLYLN